MSDKIRAISTRYAGCHFRSRLEARWAVFFDALQIEWLYESEGFETPAGRYLPDFYLPENAVWVEIKGGSFTRRDRERAEHFARDRWGDGQRYRLLQGDIPRTSTAIAQAQFRPTLPATFWSVATLVPPGPDGIGVRPGERAQAPHWWVKGHWALGGHTCAEVDAALTTARSERFA